MIKKCHNHTLQSNPRYHHRTLTVTRHRKIIKVRQPGLEVMKLEYSLKLKIKRHKQPIIVLYLKFETVLKFYNLEANSLFSIKLIAKLERTLSTLLQNQTQISLSQSCKESNHKQFTNNNRATALERTGI